MALILIFTIFLLIWNITLCMIYLILLVRLRIPLNKIRALLKLNIMIHIVEQPAVKPLIERPLLQDNCRLVSCNKGELCDDASVIVVSQIINKDDIVASKLIGY